MLSSTAYLVLGQEIVNILQPKGRIPSSKGVVIPLPTLAGARVEDLRQATRPDTHTATTVGKKWKSCLSEEGGGEGKNR